MRLPHAVAHVAVQQVFSHHPSYAPHRGRDEVRPAGVIRVFRVRVTAWFRGAMQPVGKAAITADCGLAQRPNLLLGAEGRGPQKRLEAAVPIIPRIAEAQVTLARAVLDLE